jgi:HEAT repeat protein
MADMVMTNNNKFQQALALLRNPEASFTAETIYTLSDLAGDKLAEFQRIWTDMPEERRLALILRLVETTETNFELDFSSIIRLALDDPDADGRLAAVEGVLEESPLTFIDPLIQMARADPFSNVRAAAAGALGPFILQGELGKLPESVNQRLQETVLALHKNLNEDLDVRRRSLEAIANCGVPGVPDLIREAYYADELPMRASAIFAMGRSCDDIWAPQILDELSSDYPEMRYEAARAAGELELRKALPRLAELAYEDDREVQEMAIWALGEIGGKSARNVLNQLAALAAEADDDDLSEAIQEAQSAASLAGEELLPLFDYPDLEQELDEDDFDDDFDDEDDFELYDEDDFDDEDDDFDEDDFDDHEGIYEDENF